MDGLKSIVVYIVLVLALFLVLGSCEKAEGDKLDKRLHDKYEEGYREGYATGYEEGWADGCGGTVVVSRNDGGLAGWEDALDEIKYLYGVEYPELRH